MGVPKGDTMSLDYGSYHRPTWADEAMSTTLHPKTSSCVVLFWVAERLFY